MNIYTQSTHPPYKAPKNTDFLQSSNLSVSAKQKSLENTDISVKSRLFSFFAYVTMYSFMYVFAYKSTHPSTHPFVF